MEQKTYYVIFAIKDNFVASIRTPSYTLGEARIHIQKTDNSKITKLEVTKALGLDSCKASTSTGDTYRTVLYEMVRGLAPSVEIKLNPEPAPPIYPQIALDPFTALLKHFEGCGWLVDKKTATTVYSDNFIRDCLTLTTKLNPLKQPELFRLHGAVGSTIFK